MAAVVLASGLVEAYGKDEYPTGEGCDIAAGLIGPNVSAWIMELAGREADKRAKWAAEAAAEKERREELELKLRPLITALRQTKERYPKTYVFDYEVGKISDPHFYVAGSDSIHLSYDRDTGMCQLRTGSRGGHVRVESQNVEDLIPPLVELLATAVAHVLGK